ncbi:MAG: serine/threonine-protein kinase [Planctomycetota bacterium]|nr:serine/threonine-protein kinase [Planctomycetota bacterium]
MDLAEYEQICIQFARLARSNPTERARQIDRMRVHNPSLASQLSDLLHYDQSAENSGFLEYASPLPTGLYRDDSREHRLDDYSIPHRVGHYQILAVLGRGGMGVVLKAWDDRAKRHVAIKMILPSLVSAPQLLQRFRVEIQIVARLEHRNIVPIYATGEHDGAPYFVMKHVEGSNLQENLDELDSPWRLAEAVRDLALAVSYSHDRGVIHRDLKPANVLMDRDGTPFLADFGIAKWTDTEVDLTAPDIVLGSPGYMAPELISRREALGPQVDVYGLGAILYAALTGRAPFVGNDYVDTLEQVKHRAPTPPSETHEVAPELEVICLRCLAKSPADRYPNANSLAADLNRFLRGEPLLESKQQVWQLLGNLFREQQLSLPEARSIGAVAWTLAINLLLHSFLFSIISVNAWGWLNPPWGHVGLWLSFATGLIGLFVVNYRHHWRDYWRLSLPERQSGMITLGVNIASLFMLLIYGPWTVETPLTHIHQMYPPLALIAGVVAFAHGALGSSRSLLIGAVFFPLAVLFSVVPHLSPLIYAIVSTLAIGGMYLEIVGSSTSLSRS